MPVCEEPRCSDAAALYAAPNFSTVTARPAFASITSSTEVPTVPTITTAYVVVRPGSPAFIINGFWTPPAADFLNSSGGIVQVDVSGPITWFRSISGRRLLYWGGTNILRRQEHREP